MPTYTVADASGRKYRFSSERELSNKELLGAVHKAGGKIEADLSSAEPSRGQKAKSAALEAAGHVGDKATNVVRDVAGAVTGQLGAAAHHLGEAFGGPPPTAIGKQLGQTPPSFDPVAFGGNLALAGANLAFLQPVIPLTAGASILKQQPIAGKAVELAEKGMMLPAEKYAEYVPQPPPGNPRAQFAWDVGHMAAGVAPWVLLGGGIKAATSRAAPTPVGVPPRLTRFYGTDNGVVLDANGRPRPVQPRALLPEAQATGLPPMQQVPLRPPVAGLLPPARGGEMPVWEVLPPPGQTAVANRRFIPDAKGRPVAVPAVPAPARTSTYQGAAPVLGEAPPRPAGLVVPNAPRPTELVVPEQLTAAGKTKPVDPRLPAQYQPRPSEALPQQLTKAQSDLMHDVKNVASILADPDLPPARATALRESANAVADSIIKGEPNAKLAVERLRRDVTEAVREAEAAKPPAEPTAVVNPKAVRRQIDKAPDGECYSNASKWAMDNEGSGAVVVHGKAKSADGRVIDHAWVEIGDEVVDPTAGVRTSKADYYKSVGAVAEAVYAPTDALVNSVRAGHHGPWRPGEAFKPAKQPTQTAPQPTAISPIVGPNRGDLPTGRGKVAKLSELAVDDTVLLPDGTQVSYRGRAGDQAVVYNPKSGMQFAIDPSRLTRQQQPKTGQMDFWSDETGAVNVGAIRDKVKQLSREWKRMPLFDQGIHDQSSGSRISVRNPTAAGRLQDPLAEDLRVGIRETLLDRGGAISVARALEHANVKLSPRARKLIDTHPEVALNEAKVFFADNLRRIIQQVHPDIVRRAARWYEGAHRIAQDLSKEFNTSLEASAGVIAALSPQTEWFTNLAQARTVMEVAKNQRNSLLTPEMLAKAKEITKGGKNADIKALLGEIQGVPFGKLPTYLHKAAWARLYAEAHLPRHYNLYTPEGSQAGVVMTSGPDARPAKLRANNLKNYAKALEIYDNPKREVISSGVSDYHKVRSFYNNIVQPNHADWLADVTIDTHAVAAANFMPMSAEATAVKHSMGGSNPGVPSAGNSSIHGTMGTYGVYADAYRQVAQELGIPVRAVQSITWEGVRSLFGDSWKKDKRNAQLVNDLWKDYHEGRRSLSDTRKQIERAAGGYDKPDWTKYDADGRLVSVAGEAAQRQGDAGAVRGSQLAGRQNRGGLGAGGSGRATGAAQAGIRSETGAVSLGAVKEAAKKLKDKVWGPPLTTPPKVEGGIHPLDRKHNAFLGERPTGAQYERAVKLPINENIAKLSQQFDTFVNEIGNSLETGGTFLPKELRPEVAKGAPAERQSVTSKQINQYFVSKLSGLLNDLKKAETAAGKYGDVETMAHLKTVRKRAEHAFKQVQELRRVAHESLAYWKEIYANPELKAVTDMLRATPEVRQRKPMIDQIIHQLRTKGRDGIMPAWHTAVDAARVNLFSLTSSMRDAFTNGGMLAAEIFPSIVGDLAEAHRIRTMPRTIGLAKGAKRTASRGYRLPDAIERELGTAIAGEMEGIGRNVMVDLSEVSQLPGVRNIKALQDPASRSKVATAADMVLAGPARSKRAVDNFYGRIGAWATLYEHAIRTGKQAGLKGDALQAHIEAFTKEPTKEAIEAAIANGRKLRFSKELSGIEESISRSTTVKLLFSAFPRFGFQFARTVGEQIGLSGKTVDLLKGNLKGGEAAKQIGRVLQGAGLVILARELTDHVDYNSMELLLPDGDRMRLSGLSPLPEAAAVAALLNGEDEKFLKALGSTSIGLSGGLLSSLLSSYNMQYNELNWDKFGKETVGLVNRLMPARAVMSALEAMTDPVQREGIGADIPGYSKTLPVQWSGVTGQPYEPRQRLPFTDVSLPSAGGTAFPMFARDLKPVEKLLLDHGIGTYRPSRTPLLDLNTQDVPRELRREYEELASKERFRRLSQFMANPQFSQWLQRVPFDRRSERLRSILSDADSLARRQLQRKHRNYRAPQDKTTRGGRLLPPHMLGEVPPEMVDSYSE